MVEGARRYIAIEEHFLTPELKTLLDELPSPELRLTAAATNERLLDTADLRLSAMDRAGVEMQVLSHRPPGAQLRDVQRAVVAARQANDALDAVIQGNPDRYAGFATIPIADPAAASKELVRCVEQLNFKGVMVHGCADGQFLDHLELDPILRTSADLDVPLYVHPAEPDDTIKSAYYSSLQVPQDLAPKVEMLFSGPAWGWHNETGTHALRLMLSGVFDRYPTLQVILGHWGELVPFYIARFNDVIAPAASHLRKNPIDYFAENFYVTPGGLESVPMLLLTMSVMGADRIMYSSDYPFVPTVGCSYIDDAPISDLDKDKIAHGNAERLLRIDCHSHAANTRSEFANG